MTENELPVDGRRRLDELFRSDPWAGRIGAELVAWSGGRAVVRMTPTDEQVNFAGTNHGGVLFSLADVALSYASNSWGRKAFALTISVQYLRASRPGSVLVATAVEQARTRRTGSYHVEVEADGRLATVLQAMAFRSDDWWFGDEEWSASWRGTY